jgi:hypothetical protein
LDLTGSVFFIHNLNVVQEALLGEHHILTEAPANRLPSLISNNHHISSPWQSREPTLCWKWETRMDMQVL